MTTMAELILRHADASRPGLRSGEVTVSWAAYVQEHPYAPRMFFTETTGDPEIEAIHRQVQMQATAALGVIVGREASRASAAADLPAEMAAEIMRSGLAGLAIWWSDHPDVPREEIVATALNVLWIGLERLRRGERWDRRD